jgi:hypothetical protein
MADNTEDTSDHGIDQCCQTFRGTYIRAKGTDDLHFRRHGRRSWLPNDPTSLELQKAYLQLFGKTELDPKLRCMTDVR